MISNDEGGGTRSAGIGSGLSGTASVEGGPKISRRAACSIGAGLSAAAVLGLRGGPSVAAERHDIRYVVTDQRHDQSLEFGAVLARQGAERLEVTDGLTRLWREALVPLWRGKTGAIAGLTERGVWECIAEQARSQGRRSVVVGRHALTEEGDATGHVLSASAPTLAGATALETCGAAWPRVMADLARLRADNGRLSAERRFPGATAATGALSLSLVSWVIA